MQSNTRTTVSQQDEKRRRTTGMPVSHRRWMGTRTAVCAALAVGLSAQASEYRVKASASGEHWYLYTTWEIRDPNTGVWQPATQQDGPPGSDDSVYIPNNLLVWVAGDGGNGYIAHEEAHDLYVCGDDETSGSFAWCTSSDGEGVIKINGGSSLTLHADSIVNGDIRFEEFTTTSSEDCGELRISRGPSETDPLKITGRGGRIRSTGRCGSLEAVTAGATLRIDGETPGTPSETLTVQAENFDISVPVKLNNRADVLAQYADVYLTDTRKDGNSGKWRASQGTLHVDYEVRGGATWITEGTGSALIQFNADCTLLSGNFYVKYGRVRANAMVCTTGHGYHGGQDSDGPAVSATPGHKITFHGDCE